jgi:very-short-patch-repair endonuclease
VGIRRLHIVHRGVYAVGSGNLTRRQELMAAVLACGDGAVLSHGSAAELYEIRPRSRGAIEVSAATESNPRREGIQVHRRAVLRRQDVTRHHGIGVTIPIVTIIDLAARLADDDVEAMVSDADILGLCTPVAIRAAVDKSPRRPGLARLRRLLDKRTFRLTRSKLERLFLPLAESAGLPRPLTRQWVNGFEVDFYWPEIGLVVETHGLRYHRTAAQQTMDLIRFQRHAAAGLTPLGFSHWQVGYEKPYVRATLAAVARRLGVR